MSSVRMIDDPILQNKMAKLRDKVKQVQNYQTRYSRFGGTLGGDEVDPRRDYSQEFGHPKTSSIRLETYRDMYHRNPIAKKVVDLMPRHCWKTPPSIVEDEDPLNKTKFEEAFSELGSNLKGESWYQSNEGHPLWEYLARLDRLTGIGRYGVLLIGIAGEESNDLTEPLTLDTNTQRELAYLKVFPEYLAKVSSYVVDEEDKRFGQPKMYSIEFSNTADDQIDTEATASVTSVTLEVHWTRVVHITDEIVSSVVLGIPRMLPVFDNLTDIKNKLYGGSAEMYYLGALPGLSFETHPQLGGDVDIDADAMESQIEKHLNGMQRYLVTTGMSANNLAPQVVDPTPQILAQIEAICIILDCPKRIFMGSERGELASGQDKQGWNEIVHGRQTGYVTPGIIVLVVDRFIQLGILPQPVGYSVIWPITETESPIEQAERANLLTQAIVAYVAGNGVQVLPMESFLTLVLGFDQEAAKSIMDLLKEDGMEEALKESALAPEPEPMFGNPNSPGSASTPKEVLKVL